MLDVLLDELVLLWKYRIFELHRLLSGSLLHHLLAP